MAKGVNKVTLIGNLGQDPETIYGSSGSAITKISVATTFSWKDKQTGQLNEETEWSKVVFFGRLAEIAGEYLKKGSKVYVEGRNKTTKWVDKGGVDHYTTEVIANEMQMLDSKPANDGHANSGYAPQQQPQQQQSRQQAPQQHMPAQNQQPQQGFRQPPGGFDDDIPNF